MRNDNNADFDRWYRRVDKACVLWAGVGIDDLADGNSYDAWNDGASPDEYVREKLAEEGFPSEDESPFEVVGVVEVDTITPVTYGDGSDAAVIASEDVRRANWTPSDQYRNGRYVKSTYSPLNVSVEAALRIRKTGQPLPRLF